MDDLRAAIIGYGLAGSMFHGPLIASTPGMRVASVVTGDPRRAEQARSHHPEARVVPAVEGVWERADEHDLAVIAAANEVHASLARQALDAGLPVVVDKPLAPTPADGRALIAHAERRGLPLTVFHNRRWDSDQLTLARLIGGGALGEVLRHESRIERWRPRLRGETAWRETASAARGGGVLLDLGSHLVDQALVLFGPPTHVYGEVDARRGAPGDDDAFVALRHAGGVRSHLWASAVAGAPGPRRRVLGDRAAYLVADVDGQEDALRAGVHPRDQESWGVEPESRWGRLVRGEEWEPVESERGAWPQFYGALVRALREGGALPVDPRDAVTTLEVLEAARRSSDEGTVVALAGS